jgi:hypothetical protein
VTLLIAVAGRRERPSRDQWPPASAEWCCRAAETLKFGEVVGIAGRLAGRACSVNRRCGDGRLRRGLGAISNIAEKPLT